MTELRTLLQQVLADRHAPEARTFYVHLLGMIDGRARSVWRSCYADLLSADEIDEAVADVLQRLMTRALARFRGESQAELFAFVRTVTDRCVWHRAQRKLRERRVLRQEAPELSGEWMSGGAAVADEPDMEHLSEIPLNARDQEFLVELLSAASKAEYARQHGVSRAAVTQRVQRIRERIDALRPREQEAVDAWLHLAARQVLSVRRVD